MRMMRMMRATWADMNGTSASPTRVVRGDSWASGIGNRDWKSASRTCLVETRVARISDISIILRSMGWIARVALDHP